MESYSKFFHSLPPSLTPDGHHVCYGCAVSLASTHSIAPQHPHLPHHTGVGSMTHVVLCIGIYLMLRLKISAEDSHIYIYI